MLLILRKLKQSYFNNAEFRKYLLYAVGEMVLVIVGILIALQIDNWNTERIEQETLENYLHAISRNIDSDLASMAGIRSRRINDYELGVRWQTFDRRGDSYTVPEAVFAGELISRATTPSRFNASSSGYEALKASGTLDQLQGTDIERLLYDYYDTVNRIVAIERDHNDLSRRLSLQLWAGWPRGLEIWELATAFSLTEGRFQSQQGTYRQVLKDPTTQQLMSVPTLVGPLLLEYDKLERFGSIFQRIIEAGSLHYDEEARTTLDGIYNPGSGIGQPDLIVDSQIAWHSHHVIAADANDPRVSYAAAAAELQGPYDFNSFRRTDDGLHIEYGGGAEWAGVWIAAGTNYSERSSPDYSMYDALVLELKGDLGGERIVVNMEDRDDPADGTSTRYEIELGKQWQTYEIELAEFKTADLTRLTVPLGFIFFEQPVSFSVKTARFVKKD